MTTIMLGLVAAAAIGLGIFSYWEHLVITQHTQQSKSKTAFSWIDFFAKGKDSGFSNMEIKLLYELAKKSNIEHPAALFWSHPQMDACIKFIVKRYRAAGTFNMEENKQFLDKLFEFRKKMEMEKPKWRHGITKTEEMNEMQRIQIVAGGHGTFISKLIKNTSKEMVVERPDSSSLPVQFKWKGKRIQVYFWRKDDAAYCFETVVMDEMFSSGDIPVLALAHTEKLERTQNRTNIRAKTNKPARLFIIGNEENENAQNSKSINCSMKDISDTGCSVLVGGEAKNYFRLILQFFIDRVPISLVGVVSSIDYNPENDTSLLHIAADVMPLEMRNIVRCVMFGIIDDGLETVPLEDTPNGKPENAQDSGDNDALAGTH
ncbi:MAG: PilZ domain-containing protein [Spirochaetaceae bacterium]|jgi:hypothetical protein|nr:PilZ domain-containing protein [Spirochaetaceae bacterium]